jgi:hypothetical protein
MRELALLELAALKNVLFVGETIRDVYHHVRPLGRPTKDAIVSVELVKTEEFDGGVIAASCHAKAFCANVECYSEGQLIRKERYVEASHIRKLFEVYVGNGKRPMVPPDFALYDCVVVCDYGHGMMDEDYIYKLCNGARFLAVNVQTNSGNYGFNLATKYPTADFLCVDEPEARLATQNRLGPIERSLEALAEISNKVCITLGKEGAIGLENGKVYRSPAFTDKVVDTLGAGDAFFAVTAPIAEDADMEALLRIGNAAGAIKAGIVGHRAAVTKEALIELLSRTS